MQASPPLGVFLHAVGGFASGSFYLPYKKVRNWSWESYWLAGGVFSWIIAPWLVAIVVTGIAGINVLDLFRSAVDQNLSRNLLWSYIFGAMWGIGGLTFGLTMRYLGLSLGMAVALGFCATFGTIMEPLYFRQFGSLIHSTPGLVTLGGLVVCLLGIGVCALAGMAKERELSDEAKKATIAEFDFTKGMWVAVFSGVMSACMAFGISSGEPVGALAARMGVTPALQNTPILVIVLAGGFTTNFIWCVILNCMNRSYGDYVSGRGASIVSNYVFSAIAGTMWYLQFFFYSMGTVYIGEFKFSSWTLHMATIIIFSNMWGLVLHEWKGTSRHVHRLIRIGIVVLVASTFIVGYGNYLKEEAKKVTGATPGDNPVRRSAYVASLPRVDSRRDSQITAPMK